MNTSSNQSTNKTHFRVVCRIIGMLFTYLHSSGCRHQEVDKASRIIEAVRDANTNIPLPAMAITVENDFTTVSRRPPDAGEYPINYEGCNFSI